MRVALAFLLLLGALAATPLGGPAAAASGNKHVVRTATVSLAPGDSGSVHANVSYTLPDGLRSLTVAPGPYQTVLSTRGFTRSGGSYQWDGHTPHPRLIVRVQVNRTYSGRANVDTASHAATDTRQGYSFVATPNWAIAPVPTMRTKWTWVGSGSVSLDRRARVAGEGATGGEIAYLGPFRSYNATGGGQHFRLVVPASANPVVKPSRALAALVDASNRLQVGARDPNVFFVVAPADVQWGPAGLEYGGSDAWVEGDQRLDTAADTWVHEYVHTRQEYQPTAQTQWTVEATAVYESALVDLESGRIGFRAFADALSRGTNSYPRAVLTDPSSWPSVLVPYEKGATTLANLDYRLRTAGSGSFANVLGRLNAHRGNVTQSVFLDAVAGVGNESTRAAVRGWTETTDTPAMYSRSQYDRAFGTLPSRVAVTFPADAFRVSGPTRTVASHAPPTLVTGETLNATARVANTGGEPGNYSVDLHDANGTLVSKNGTLAPGENVTVALSHTFDSPGTYSFTAGYRTDTVVVLPPATPAVSALSVPAGNVTAGDTVNATLTLTNPAERPANGSVPVTLDGSRVGSVTVALPPGGSTTQTVPVTVPTAGTHTVAAGGHDATVTAVEPTRTAAGTPGFGLPAFAAALLALLLCAYRG